VFADLIPLDDVSQLSAIERERNLGLAYFGLSQQQANPAAAAEYRGRAQNILADVRAAGLPDGEVVAALARLQYSQGNAQAASQLSAEALQSGHLPPKARVNALYYIGERGVRTAQVGPAERALQQLTAERRLSEDWRLLGACRQRAGDPQAALVDLHRAVEIAPFRPELRSDLAQLQEWLGDKEAAQRERTIAAKLAKPAAAKP
jgi:tetratricopeptide (TPR) repeat protein